MPIEDPRIKGLGLGLLSTWALAAKPCDSCKSSPALLFCRPDSAFLCGPCDSRIHAANKLASRHDRVLVCEVCEQSPAVVTCKADAASLCASCDRDIHSANPLARRHERLPVVPFFHSPSDLSAKSSLLLAPTDVHHPPSVDNSDDSWLIPNIQGKLAGADFLCSSDFDSFMDSGPPDFDFKSHGIGQLGHPQSYASGAGSDSVVPNQTKSPNLNNFYNESCFEIDFTKSKLSPFNYSAQCIDSQSVSSSDFGIVPDGNSNSISEVSDFHLSNSMSGKGGGFDGGSAAQPVPLSRIDREARVMRYREKRKNRKFEKTIRYASRKAYAETRPRIKGRFARRTDADAGVDQIYADPGGIGGFLVDDDMYGVVPSF